MHLLMEINVVMLFPLRGASIFGQDLVLREHVKSSDAKASKCHLKFSSKMIIFIKLVYLSSVISLKWQ